MFWSAEADTSAVLLTQMPIILPAADNLEDIVLPTVDRIVETVRRSLNS